MKDKKDIFAGIAVGGVSGRKDSLVETKPLPTPDVFFTESNDEYVTSPDKLYIEKLDEFKKGIADLKERYSPYLQKMCKNVEEFRNKQYLEDFKFKFNDDKEIQNIKIPHYTGPVGRWTALYSTEFHADSPIGKRIFLVFKGVDYIADVYVNGIYAGSHEGFFASFEFDITDFIKEENTLEVIVKNDIPTLGNGDMQVNGDKLYAATGVGWDGPEDGWHHCPAGGGIFDRVYLETRSPSFIEDVFIRPDIESGIAHVMVSYFSQQEENTHVEIHMEILPYNFIGKEFKSTNKFPCGYGMNYFNVDIPMDGFVLWQPEKPFLYQFSAITEYDSMEKTFGMRKFHMNDSNEPKGDLYLNNKLILLRGANEMGHMQLCVMRNDFDQLIEDILIAKYCNMNYYRLTQRPVQEEIYHYCDMLGMLCQTDFPLFGYMRKNKFYEGIKQAGEMERHVRNHPSVIMSTYINEPFAPDKYSLGHRHLSRKELELFFDACDAATYLENPDRVIKRVEGDYDPPTEKGLSDFHCYNMWYTNHALPIGMLYKGYLPALNKGWKTGCGEYGAEGLDNYEVMRKYYPSEWLPENDNDYWIPDGIVKSQTNTMHGDWFEEQNTIKDWIFASQEHQAMATELMTLAFRRRSDRIVSTAIHLLIDAWPSGWMKTLLDVDRVPKKAYFAFKESLEPLKVNLRCDRWSGYCGDEISVEAWALNDVSEDYSNISMISSMEVDGKIFSNHRLEEITANACTSHIAGIIKTKLPVVLNKVKAHMNICMKVGGEIVSKDSMDFTIYPKPAKSLGVFCVGKEARAVAQNSPYLHIAGISMAAAVIISSPDEYHKTQIPKGLLNMFLLPEGDKKIYSLEDSEYTFKPIFDPGEVGEDGDLKGLSFVALAEEMKKTFGSGECSYWYNDDKEFIDHVAEYYIDVEPDNLYAFGFEKPSFGKRTEGKKKRLPVACSKNGKIFLSFETKGRIGNNPVLDGIISKLLTEAQG